MCGICGFISKNKFPSDIILKMNNAIRHRGEDDEGYVFGDLINFKNYSGDDSYEAIKTKYQLLKNDQEGFFSLGFRRLSIIDLTENGHQPMISEQGNIITFNGEIYNFKEIKNELLEYGYTFKSNTDTEVIIKGYEHFGIDIIKKLDGMFAFCIYDVEKKQLIFARDRIGIKPLFYFYNSQNLIWASEIKSILSAHIFEPKINWKGLKLNFMYQTTIAPETCFENIFSVEPGYFMVFDTKNFKLKKIKYWEIPKPSSQHISIDSAALKVEELLRNSVNKQLISDVPLISMMSGGIDSTLISILAKKKEKNLTSFTVNYQEAEEEIINAKMVAKENSIIHEVVAVGFSEIFENLKENIAHFEEPYCSIEVLINAAKYAKSKNYKVVLTGNGADELFGGYSHLLKINRWKKFKKFSFLAPLIPKLKYDILFKIRNQLELKSIEDFFRQGQSGMRNEEIDQLFLSQNNIKLLKTDNVEVNYASYFKEDISKSLSSHHVFRDDLSAMKNGVEFRYPYLSNELIDYIAQLPENIRFNGVENKPLLRKVAKKYLPDEIMKMPKKGFSFPMKYWYKKDHIFRAFIIENIDFLKKRKIFNNEIIDIWMKRIEKDFELVKIWQLVTFEIWMQKYFDPYKK